MRYLALIALMVTLVAYGTRQKPPASVKTVQPVHIVVVPVATPWCVRALVQSTEGPRHQVKVCTDTEEFCRANRDVIIKLMNATMMRWLAKTLVLASSPCAYEH